MGLVEYRISNIEQGILIGGGHFSFDMLYWIFDIACHLPTFASNTSNQFVTTFSIVVVGFPTLRTTRMREPSGETAYSNPGKSRYSPSAKNSGSPNGCSAEPVSGTQYQRRLSR